MIIARDTSSAMDVAGVVVNMAARYGVV